MRAPGAIEKAFSGAAQASEQAALLRVEAAVRRVHGREVQQKPVANSH